MGYGIPVYGEATGAGSGEPVLAGTTGTTGTAAGAPPWNHPHGPVIRSPHRDCGIVRQWQQRMKDQGRQIDVDADYGPKSEQVCRSFQGEKGLEVDGVIGPKTSAKSWE